MIRRIANAVERLSLRYRIWETEQWLRACDADGLLEGRNLDLIRAELGVMRARLYALGGTDL